MDPSLDWNFGFGDAATDTASSYHESNYEDVLVTSREGSVVESPDHDDPSQHSGENPFDAESHEEDDNENPFEPRRHSEDNGKTSTDRQLRPQAIYRPNILSEWSSGIESSLTESSDESGTRRVSPSDRYSTAARAKVLAPEVQRALPATEKFYSVNNLKGNNLTINNEDSAEPAEQLITMPEPIEPAKMVHFKDLFRFTNTCNKMVLCLGLFCAICGGALIPFMPVIFSQFATSFLQVGTDAKPVLLVLVQYTLYFVILASCEFIAIFISTFCFTRTGEQITRQLREEYLAALLRQEIDHFSRIGVGEYTSRLTEDINVIQKGISEKVARTIHALSTFTCAFIIAFYCNWRLAAELLWSVGAGLIVMSIGLYFSSSLNTRISDANSKSASMAGEAVSSIRMIKALNAEGRFAKRYMQAINEAAKWSTRQKIQVGASLGFTITVNYLNIALILWQGSRLIAQGKASFTNVFIIELVISQALYALIGIANHVETFSKALGAANKVYQIIDRPSDFDATSDEGNTLDTLRSIIKFENVSFRYPSRPGVKILDDIDLTFPAGQTTALVGASGSGKSSIVDLILRFYDPKEGQVLLDGVAVNSLNLSWLRKQIGVVNQNPGFFDVSIGENIRYGLVGTPYAAESAEAQQDRVVIAAKAANAHGFIENLPGAYDFLVGEHGSKLSGGQKQRIAIARALVANPKILLLDEATSAMDSESEAKIVASLEAEKASRTTIIVAHRLSTVKRADNIVVLEKGQVLERGTHELLMFERGAYYNLVKAGQSLQMDVEPANPVVAKNVRASSVYSKPEDPLSPILRPSQQSAMVSLDPSSKAEPLAAEGFDFHSGVELDTLDAQGKLGAPKFRLPVEPKYTIWELVRFAIGFNSSERWLNVAGICCCFFAGAEEAVNAILFGMSTISLSLPQGQYGDMLTQVTMWAWLYFGFALFQLIVFGGQGIYLGISSERMIQRVKESAFHHALRQDVAFYDVNKSSTSTMVSLLSSETKNMCGLSGFTLGNLMIVASTLFSAVFIAIGFGWKLALVCTATLPIVLGCGFLSVAFLGQHSETTSGKILAAANAAAEALSEIRTVAILTRESEVIKQYSNALGELEKKSLWTVLKVSLVYAVCQSVVYLCMALGFWFGGTLIAKGEYSPLQFFVAFTSVIFGARSAGYFFSFADDMAKAIKGTSLVKELLERKVLLDVFSGEGDRVHSKFMGALQFVNVSFRYPGREEFVLKNLSFSAMPNEKVAIVGPSGGGKSSIIGLIERFYDPISGSVLMDGEHINRKNLEDYRSQLSLVSQDVDLYEGTIRENILLGSGRPPSPWFSKQIRLAVASANLTEFVDSLPDGLDTYIGAKGCMLSGGQKQRIAIARAIIRDPAILLMDEATSALDSHSENVVQRALDAASEGRTTIIVAHRLNTIRNADRILFLEGGKFVESGKHEELMAKKGRYAEFVRLQEMEEKIPLAFD